MRKNTPFQTVWIRVSLVLLVVAGLGYVFTNFLQKDRVYVPKEFFEARGRGAVIAGEIVRLSEESLRNLRAIDEQNANKNYSAGLDLVLQEISRNELARKNGADLTVELVAMSEKISEILPEKASDAGLRAILESSQIVHKLVSYNNYMYQLLDQFRSRFIEGASVSDSAVRDLILKMNGEILAINDLNSRYKASMAEFDRLTAEK